MVGSVQNKDDYRTWYIEAMVASNEAGFVGLSAAQTIRALSAAQPEPVIYADELAHEIRRVGGDHSMDAWVHARLLMPFLSARLRPTRAASVVQPVDAPNLAWQKPAKRMVATFDAGKVADHQIALGTSVHLLRVALSAAKRQAAADAQWGEGSALVLDLRAALVLAEAALSDIGDADREPGDDVAWCERRAAQALPEVRQALELQFLKPFS